MGKKVRGRNPEGKPNNLKEIRTKEGLSRSALAAASEVVEQTVRRVEQGRRSAATTRYKILRGLNALAKRKQEYEYQELYPHDSTVDE